MNIFGTKDGIHIHILKVLHNIGYKIQTNKIYEDMLIFFMRTEE